jgi:hypothetical protein
MESIRRFPAGATDRICVFCGSSAGTNDSYAEKARELGRTLARRRIAIVYGGGGAGLMGALADAALDAGGEVIGVIPWALQRREIAHRALTRLEVVSSMHERKARMAELASGFVALPGGMGTLEELAEVLTWAQLGVHAKPIALVDVAGYYRPLVAFLDQAVAHGFLRPEHRALLLVADGAEEVLQAFASWRPPPLERWIDERTA